MFLDEVDKIASVPGVNMSLRDVGGEGVQQVSQLYMSVTLSYLMGEGLVTCKQQRGTKV